MAHERKAIRDAIVALLSGHTDAGTRIFKSRMAPIRAAELPAISVYTDSESVKPESASTAPRELTRTLTVGIDAWVNASGNLSENLDDTFDAMALQIETALDADVDLAGTVFWSCLAATEMGVKMDGDRPMGCVHLEYTCVYHTDLRTAIADAARDNYDTADIKIQVTPDADPSEDKLLNLHG